MKDKLKILIVAIIATLILGTTVSWVFGAVSLYLWAHLLFGPLDWYLYTKLYNRLRGGK
jgi:hypothetical protein